MARASAHLRSGRFEQAREETLSLLEHDTSRRARYFHGVACARLHDWSCAVQMLEPIASSREAAWFPQLPLELAFALWQGGALGEARRWLERARKVPELAEIASRSLQAMATSASRRSPELRWNLRGAVGNSFDYNPERLPEATVGDADPQQPETDASGVAYLVFERLFASMLWDHQDLDLALSGELRHQHYFDARVRFQDYLYLRTEAALKRRERLELGMLGEAMLLNQATLSPDASVLQGWLRAYSRQQQGLSAWVQLDLALDRYRALPDALGPGTDYEVPGSSSSLGAPMGTSYCMECLNGTRTGFEAVLQHRRKDSSLLGGLNVRVEQLRPSGNGYRFLGASLKVWSRRRLREGLDLHAGLSVLYRRYLTDRYPAAMGDAGPFIALQATVVKNVSFSCQYATGRSTRWLPDSITHVPRNTLSVELRYGW